jgi:hypothetical protein
VWRTGAGFCSTASSKHDGISNNVGRVSIHDELADFVDAYLQEEHTMSAVYCDP